MAKCIVPPHRAVKNPHPSCLALSNQQLACNLEAQFEVLADGSAGWSSEFLNVELFRHEQSHRDAHFVIQASPKPPPPLAPARGE